jgi:hypothetical protein
LALTFATFIISFGSYEGWFVPWESLGQPPEQPTKLIANTDGLWVETTLGHVYQYAGSQCGAKCWALADYPKPATRPSWTQCGWLPPSPPFSIDTETVAGPWGPGCYLTAYAIRLDGNIFMWAHGMGEGGSIWAYAIALLVLPISFLVALMIVTSRNNPPSTGQGEFTLWKH